MRRIDPSLAHRLFYPGVPAVLATRAGGTVAAMPVVSYAALSERPPLFGVSCGHWSFTQKVVREARAFSLCLLGTEHIAAYSLLVSIRGKRGSDKLMEAGLRHRSGRRVGAPIISGCVAALECSLHKSIRLGDHVLLVGKVEAAWASADFQKYWRFKEYEPILYTGWQGGMSTYRRR